MKKAFLVKRSIKHNQLLTLEELWNIDATDVEVSKRHLNFFIQHTKL